MCFALFGEDGNGHNSSIIDQDPSLGGKLDTHRLAPLREGVAIGVPLRLGIKGWS